VHYPYFDPFFRTLPFTNKHKTIVTVHDLTPLVFPEHFPPGLKGTINWQLQRFNLKKADGIVTDSTASKKDIEKLTGISKEKISVAYLAGGEEFRRIKIEDSKLKMLQKKYNLPGEFILYVGDVTWNKNLPRLLNAVENIDIPLVLVGKSLVSTDFDKQNIWNKDLIEIQRLAEQNKNIVRLGFVPTEDLVDLYNLATVFVFPSVYEGFGLPIVEAMQSGTPVVISRESCMPEVGGEAVEYFDGYDTESLTNTIAKVLESKKLQKELSEKGLIQAKNFSWKKTAEQTIEAYKKAITK
jgi:glycosyltransferase involved in cell wall biosynthesis